MIMVFFLTWFDRLVVQLTGHSPAEPPTLDEDMQGFLDKIVAERDKAERTLKDVIYGITQTEAAKRLTSSYHAALVALIGRAYEAGIGMERTPLQPIYHCVVTQLELLLAGFENEFGQWLDDDARVPITQLLPLCDLISDEMENLIGKLHADGTHGNPSYLVRQYLLEFVARVKERQPVTRRELRYWKEVISDIQRIDDIKRISDDCPLVNELVMYWNLNSRETIEYFLRGINRELAKRPTLEDKLDFWRLELKLVDQIPERKDFIYRPEFPSLRPYFRQYILREIEYLQNIASDYSVRLPKINVPDVKLQERLKVMVHLSVDQISILLKALYEKSVLKAGSLSAVFKAIVPVLSTPNTENPSWKSARKRVDDLERRDIELVAALLEDLAVHIRTF